MSVNEPDHTLVSPRLHPGVDSMKATTASKRLFLKKSFKRKFVRYGLLTGNVALLLVIGLFVARSSDVGNGLQGAPAVASAQLGSLSASDASIANPLDRLSSADIALNVARAADLPEKIAVTNQADSENAQLAVSQSAGGLVSKPQVVSSDFKSNKDIRSYTAVAGDTAATIAAKFQVTSDSVMWSNDLASETVTAGQSLFIPPAGVNGIVYVVKAGDTPEKLAEKFRTSKDKVVAYNDAEIAGLVVGTRVIVPDGQIIKPVVQVAPRRSGGSGTNFAFGGSSPIYNGANGYDYGYCTWYVANRIAVPSNWGNANTWDNLAPRSGWVVSTSPRVGAIGQTDRGAEGHVAVITEVSADGTQIKYADMNGVAGYGREGFSGWTSVSKYEHYIYR